MTKFIDGSKKSELKKEVKKTVFTHFVNVNREVARAISQPEDYDNVEFLFHDDHYGDVFKAWDNINSDNITLFFGTKGDEDYQ
jgi:hypothetical protein